MRFGARTSPASARSPRRLGMARSFQLVHVFPDLTVRETLRWRWSRGAVTAWLFAVGRRPRACDEVAREVAALFGLGDKLDTPGAAPAAGRQEAARRGQRLRAAAGGHPARRADQRRQHRRQARHHGQFWSAAAATGVRAIIQVEHDMDIVVRLFRPHRRAPPGPRARRHAAGTIMSATGDERWPPSSAAGRRARAPLDAGLDDLDVFMQASHVLRKRLARGGAGEVVCLVGRNGAGKTTSSARSWATAGRRPAPHLQGRGICGRRTHAIVRSGLGSRRRTAGSSPTSPWPRTSILRPGRGRAGVGGRARRAGLRHLPAASPVRRRAAARDVRRGAQDALDRARAGAGPRDAAARRAVRGSLARDHSLHWRRIAAIRGSGRGVLIAESNIHHVPATAPLYVIERGEIIFAGPLDDPSATPPFCG